MSTITNYYTELRNSIQWGLITSILTLVSCLTFSFFAIDTLNKRLLEQQHQAGQQIAQQGALLLRNNLRNDDRVSANVMLQDFVDGGTILSATLYNNNQQAIAEFSKNLSDGAHFNWIEQRITDQEQLIGHLRVAVSQQEAHSVVATTSSIMILGSIIASLVLGLLSYLISNRRTQHSQLHIEALRKLETGEPVDLLQVKSQIHDITEVTECINQLIDQKTEQAALHRALNQFTSPRPLPGSEKNVSYHDSAILFIEIANMDALQQKLSAEELVDTLNTYYQQLSQAAKLYNGTIDRYQGDGLVMLFGFPEKHPRDADHCLYASHLFQGLLESLDDPSLQVLSFKMAAHWGPVLIAPMASGESQKQMHVIGDTLHWAAHLAHHSQEGELLVSTKLIEQLEETQIEWKTGPELTDLDKSPQATHWLKALPTKADALIDRQVKHIASISHQESN